VVLGYLTFLIWWAEHQSRMFEYLTLAEAADYLDHKMARHTGYAPVQTDRQSARLLLHQCRKWSPRMDSHHRCPKTARLQRAAIAAMRLREMVERDGYPPSIPGCKPSVIVSSPTPHKWHHRKVTLPTPRFWRPGCCLQLGGIKL
jgi:hypothetical protein